MNSPTELCNVITVLDFNYTQINRILDCTKIVRVSNGFFWLKGAIYSNIVT